MKTTLSTLIFVLLLTGCYKPPADRAGSWAKPGADQDQIYSDIASCRQQADAMIERDASIDADIGTTGLGGTATDLEQNMAAYDAGRRHRNIVAECMYGRGYALSSDG